MKRIISVILALLIISSLFSAVCFAEEPVEGNCFLRIDGIEGNCRDAAHERWIDLTDYTVNNTIIDTNGNEIPTSITYTSRDGRAAAKIYDRYTAGVWYQSSKLDITRVAAGKRETVSAVEMGKCKIMDFCLVELEDGAIAVKFTLVSNMDPNRFSQIASIFGPGSIALICAAVVVIIGISVFFIVRKKRSKSIWYFK